MESEKEINTQSAETQIEKDEQEFVPIGENNTETTENKYGGWSWGGFTFGIAYAIAVRKYIYLIVLPLLLVPMVNILTMLALGIVLGLSGHKLAYESPTFASEEEARGFIKAIDHAGRVFFFITLALTAIGFFVTATFFSLGSSY